MVFKRLLGAIGVGGPSVNTVLDGEAGPPGGVLALARRYSALTEARWFAVTVFALILANAAGRTTRPSPFPPPSPSCHGAPPTARTPEGTQRSARRQGRGPSGWTSGSR